MEPNSVIFTVNEINTYIKAILTSDPKLRFIRVKGEISNFKIYPSGHLYFSLKDDSSVINAVMFANYAKKVVFTPKNGDEIIVLASVDAYTARGSYNLTIYEMEENGRGQQLLELEKLKKKLASEGLFDASRKRSIYIFPKAIGVITAPNGAAVRDIVTNIKRRYPIADIYVFPSLVQGEQAPKELLNAFNVAQTYDLDTLIIGRGGGASEDLSAFNDETLVRAIANSKMPVIAAVGHEIDSTLVDYVADKRASTPTGAAELSTVDLREIKKEFNYSQLVMEDALHNKISNLKDEVIDLKDELTNSMNSFMNSKAELVEVAKSKLKLIDPESVIKRGYSIVRSNNKIIKSINDVNEKELLDITLSDGTIVTEVKGTK